MSADGRTRYYGCEKCQQAVALAGVHSVEEQVFSGDGESIESEEGLAHSRDATHDEPGVGLVSLRPRGGQDGEGMSSPSPVDVVFVLLAGGFAAAVGVIAWYALNPWVLLLVPAFLLGAGIRELVDPGGHPPAMRKQRL